MIPFSTKDIIWFEIYLKNGNVYLVLDFIRGEEMNPGGPCSFIQQKNKQLGQRASATLLYEV